MMKSEFENLIGKEINQKEYDIVELVYNYHPLIQDKIDISRLYTDFGMRIIKDMIPTAERARDLEAEKQKAILELKLLRDKIKDIEAEYNDLSR